MASAIEAQQPELYNGATEKDDVERRGSVAKTEKGRWERLWPVIACGAGLFSDGYLNNVRTRKQTHKTNPRSGKDQKEREEENKHILQCDKLIRTRLRQIEAHEYKWLIIVVSPDHRPRQHDAQDHLPRLV